MLEFAVVAFAGKGDVLSGNAAELDHGRRRALRDDVVVTDHGVGSRQRLAFAGQQLAGQHEFAEHVEVPGIARGEHESGGVRVRCQRPLEAFELHFGVVSVIIGPERFDVAARHEDEVPSAGPVEVFEQQFDLPVVPPVQEVELLVDAGEIAVAAEGFG